MDFTRTAGSVQKTGADLTKWAKQQETKVAWCSFKCLEDNYMCVPQNCTLYTIYKSERILLYRENLGMEECCKRF